MTAPDANPVRRPVFSRANQHEERFISLLILALLIPTVLVTQLETVLVIAPIAVLGGYWFGIRRGFPSQVPQWVMYDLLTVLLIIYGTYSIGSLVPAGGLLILLVAMGIWELSTNDAPGQATQTAASLIAKGIPVAIIFPRSEAFRFDALTDRLAEGDLEATLSRGPAGCAIVAVVDLIIPGSLAVAITTTTTQAFEIGALTLSAPAIGVVTGIIGGVSLILYIDPESEIGISTATIPGALLGLGVVMLVTGTSWAALF